MYPTEIFRDTLSRLLGILTQHGVRFHLTGGITSVAYGEPRMTQDIDIVVDNPALARMKPASMAAVMKVSSVAIRHSRSAQDQHLPPRDDPRRIGPFNVARNL